MFQFIHYLKEVVFLKLLYKKYWGIPRGGSVVAGLTRNAVMNPEEADFIIDDLTDSGKT
jgi:hypothetical protein